MYDLTFNNANKGRRKRKRSDYIRRRLTAGTLSSPSERINIVHHQRTSDDNDGRLASLLQIPHPLIFHATLGTLNSTPATRCSKSYDVGGVRHIGGRSSIPPIGTYQTLAWVPTAPNNPGTCPTNQPPHPRVSRAHKQHRCSLLVN